MYHFLRLEVVPLQLEIHRLLDLGEEKPRCQTEREKNEMWKISEITNSVLKKGFENRGVNIKQVLLLIRTWIWNVSFLPHHLRSLVFLPIGHTNVEL